MAKSASPNPSQSQPNLSAPEQTATIDDAEITEILEFADKYRRLERIKQKADQSLASHIDLMRAKFASQRGSHARAYHGPMSSPKYRGREGRHRAKSLSYGDLSKPVFNLLNGHDGALSTTEIAKKLGCSQTIVGMICRDFVKRHKINRKSIGIYIRKPKEEKQPDIINSLSKILNEVLKRKNGTSKSAVLGSGAFLDLESFTWAFNIETIFKAMPAGSLSPHTLENFQFQLKKLDAIKRPNFIVSPGIRAEATWSWVLPKNLRESLSTVDHTGE